MKIEKIPNQLITKKLTSLDLTKITGLALHHMANKTWSVKDVEAYHVNKNGWIAIGYNFWVAYDGTIYEGRGFNVGAGVLNQNSSVISVGFQGDYHSAPFDMPDAQFNAGIDIINYIKGKCPNIGKIGGHGDFMATSCPGRYFPLAEMIAGKKRGVNMITTAEQAIQKLVEKGIINSPDYWNLACQVVKNLDLLLIKVSNII